MTTAREVKRLAALLLARNDDLALVGRWIVLKPLKHVFRAILVDRTISGDEFRPKSAIGWSFERSKEMPAFRLADLPWRGESWNFSNAGVADAFAEYIESKALPELRQLGTIDALNRFRYEYWDTEASVIFARRIPGLLAAGRFAEARDYAKIPYVARIWRRIFEEVRVAPLLFDDLAPTSNDIEQLARVLHEWEAYTVQHNKLTPLWERTPFPIEIEYGLARRPPA